MKNLLTFNNLAVRIRIVANANFKVVSGGPTSEVRLPPRATNTLDNSNSGICISGIYSIHFTN